MPGVSHGLRIELQSWNCSLCSRFGPQHGTETFGRPGQVTAERLHSPRPVRYPYVLTRQSSVSSLHIAVGSPCAARHTSRATRRAKLGRIMAAGGRLPTVGHVEYHMSLPADTPLIHLKAARPPLPTSHTHYTPHTYHTRTQPTRSLTDKIAAAETVSWPGLTAA